MFPPMREQARPQAEASSPAFVRMVSDRGNHCADSVCTSTGSALVQRRAEICALRVGRVDLAKGRITVAESVTEVQGSGLHFSEPKTYERRSVTLPAFLAEKLTTHMNSRPDQPDAFVFTSPEGSTLNHKNFYRRHFRPALAAADLPAEMRFHDLRHTCAALGIALSAHPKAIKERLCHSSITVTLDRYGHMFPKLDEALTARLDDLHRTATAH